MVATDYQGEGDSALDPTKRLLPYLVGVSAARNTIDIVDGRRLPRRVRCSLASQMLTVAGRELLPDLRKECVTPCLSSADATSTFGKASSVTTLPPTWQALAT